MEGVAQELSPQYSGYFLADATSVSIEGEKNQLLVTADAESQDIPYTALCKGADHPSWKMVLQRLRDRIHYPAKGVIVDGHPGLIRAIRKTFPEILIQLCIKHLHSYHVYHPKYLF